MKTALKVKGFARGSMEEEGLDRLILSHCFSWLLSGFDWILSISGPSFLSLSHLSLTLNVP